jgi:septal ring factor EnvC (AmiA/AmiB activator)
MFRPHGISGALRLAVGVIVFFAVSFAIMEAGNVLRRKLRGWTERMERATGNLGAKRDLASGSAEAQDTGGFLYETGLDEDYSLDRILQRARAASPTGEISPATRQRLETLSRQLDEANKELEEHQEKRAWEEAQRAVDRIKEEVARKKRHEERKPTRAELDAEFDGLVQDLKLLVGRSKEDKPQ